tara:strand:- start:1202 stop:1807 length:606 start_codon:yes stop_codon:yes gene_type:complete
MNFKTIKVIIYSLIIVFFVHYSLKVILVKEQLYKNRMRKNNRKVSFNLPLEVNESESKESNKESVTNENSVDQEEMKKELMDLLNTENLYDVEENTSDKKGEVSTVTEDSNKKNLDKYFSQTVSNDFKNPLNEENSEKVLKEADIDNQSKQSIYTSSNTADNTSYFKNDNWVYKDESIMNGGEISNGVYGWDCNDDIYAKF